MPTLQPKSRTISRIRAKARGELITQLKDDHQRVKKAYAKFRKLDADEDAALRHQLVDQVLDELSLHAQLEEELLYPTAREALAERQLVDEAEVEHEMLHILMDQLRSHSPEDEDRDARFTVLCEYTLHHVKEEEREMFPLLAKAKLDWPALLSEFVERRSTLSPRFAQGGDGRDGSRDGAADRARMEMDEGLPADDEAAAIADHRRRPADPRSR